jgi:hypothetical protein
MDNSSDDEELPRRVTINFANSDEKLLIPVYLILDGGCIVLSASFLGIRIINQSINQSREL